ncbi:hypothetical protein LJR034_009232 [Caballeronia sp. LjRoot34]|jgi:hypothetical protein
MTIHLRRLYAKSSLHPAYARCSGAPFFKYVVDKGGKNTVPIRPFG